MKKNFLFLKGINRNAPVVFFLLLPWCCGAAALGRRHSPALGTSADTALQLVLFRHHHLVVFCSSWLK